MTIDWTISVGNIITLMGTAITMLGIAWAISKRFDSMERKVNFMFAWFIKQLKPEDMAATEMKRFFDGGHKGD